MKKILWILLLGGLGIFYVKTYQKYKDNEVPVVRCIGLEPALDEVRDRFNRDTVRNLVYLNDSGDPHFYESIVQKVESCERVISQRLFKRDNIDGYLFALDDSPYSPNDLHDKVAFISPDWNFYCVIYNGDAYVVVVLTSLY